MNFFRTTDTTDTTDTTIGKPGFNLGEKKAGNDKAIQQQNFMQGRALGTSKQKKAKNRKLKTNKPKKAKATAKKKKRKKQTEGINRELYP